LSLHFIPLICIRMKRIFFPKREEVAKCCRNHDNKIFIICTLHKILTYKGDKSKRPRRLAHMESITSNYTHLVRKLEGKRVLSSIVTHSYMFRPCWVIFRENFLLSLY
jgi:hypothetical protein